MARPRSENRQAALLAAAKAVFAAQGLAAPTALISKTAGVSEGSFFTYFKTKDELVAALYRSIRRELALRIADGFPKEGSVRARLAHVWRAWIGWGVADPVARRALKVLNLSPAVTEELRAETAALYADVDRIEHEAKGSLGYPPAMAPAALKALAEMTMDLIERDPGQAEAYMAAGFEMLWGALTAGA